MSNNYRMLVQNVRISFPHLFQPRAAAPGAQPKFSCSLVVPKDHPAIAELTTAFNTVVQATWPQGPPEGMDTPWVDGDTDPKLNDPKKAPNIFVGAIKFQCNSATRPSVVDKQGDRIIDIIDPGKIYPGCFVHASISLYSYVNKPGNGVTFGLDGIMFAGDGDRLDGRPTKEDMFGSVPGAPAPTAAVPGMPVAGAPAGAPPEAAPTGAPVAAGPPTGLPQ